MSPPTLLEAHRTPTPEDEVTVSQTSPEALIESPISEAPISPPHAEQPPPPPDPEVVAEDIGSPQPEQEPEAEEKMDVDLETEEVDEDRVVTPLSSLESVQAPKEEPQTAEVPRLSHEHTPSPQASPSPVPDQSHSPEQEEPPSVTEPEAPHLSPSPTPPPAPLPEIHEPSEHEPSPPVEEVDTTQPFIEESESMQGIEEAPVVIRAPQRPLPHDTSEDNVLDILQPSEPPLPIVRSESALSASHYVLATPPPSSLFAPAFKFVDVRADHQHAASSSSRSSKLTHPASRAQAIQAQYSLPPVDSLPAEFQRKAKSSRQKKREKDKEKDKIDSKGHQEWAPMGVNKWGAVLRANPVSKRVSRAVKCLSTHDWNVSHLF